MASIEADPGATFYRGLQERYGQSYPITDADVRVVVTVRPTSFLAVTGGLSDRSS